MMAETSEKPELVLNLEELLQCPVCYEIPIGQIFQCNEGHHVCGRCKMRLNVCPVCRAFFFGTRNYAMEELIANFMKVNKKKCSSKDSVSSIGSLHAAVIETSDTEIVIRTPPVVEEHESDSNPSTNSLAPPLSCRGLYRCLCCQEGSVQRLPLARLLNHLRYFHSPSLIEASCENTEYIQMWQFSSIPGRIVTALRVKQMGVFFLIIEIIDYKVLHAWITMAASAWVSHGFNYTLSISSNDREAIVTDSVWSVKACEGTLKKNGHTLSVTGANARAMITSGNLSGKLSIRRLNYEELPNQTQPRGILRVANRRVHSENSNDIDLQGVQSYFENAMATIRNIEPNGWNSEIVPITEQNSRINVVPLLQDANAVQPLSGSARRRMRRRLRNLFSSPPDPEDHYTVITPRQVANINRQTNSSANFLLLAGLSTPIQSSSARATIDRNNFIRISGVANATRPGGVGTFTRQTDAANVTRESDVANSGRPTNVANSMRPTADVASSGTTINVTTSGRTTGVANSARPTSAATAVRINGVANSAGPTGVVNGVANSARRTGVTNSSRPSSRPTGAAASGRTTGIVNSSRPTADVASSGTTINVTIPARPARVATSGRTTGVDNSARPTSVATAVRMNGVANSAGPTGVVNGVANSARRIGVVSAFRTNGIDNTARPTAVSNSSRPSSRPTCFANPTRATVAAASGRTTGIVNSSRPTGAAPSGVANSSRPTSVVSSSVNTNRTAPVVIQTDFAVDQEALHSQPSSSSGSSNRQPQANRPNKKKLRHRR